MTGGGDVKIETNKGNGKAKGSKMGSMDNVGQEQGNGNGKVKPSFPLPLQPWAQFEYEDLHTVYLI